MVLVLRIWSCLHHWKTHKTSFRSQSWNYTGWVVISDCACWAENAGLAGSTAIIFVVHLLTRNYWREAAGTRPGTTYPTGACQLMHHRIALIRWILNRVAQLLLQAKIYLACKQLLEERCWNTLSDIGGDMGDRRDGSPKHEVAGTTMLISVNILIIRTYWLFIDWPIIKLRVHVWRMTIKCRVARSARRKKTGHSWPISKLRAGAKNWWSESVYINYIITYVYICISVSGLSWNFQPDKSPQNRTVWFKTGHLTTLIKS